ncbi:hypothetical protein T484DRAFT_1769131 [Baffinella frigidus]|nr:hypothetical protein T484DRAFT_1769131 [Cryptophyta sp. CCMP2293]
METRKTRSSGATTPGASPEKSPFHNKGKAKEGKGAPGGKAAALPPAKQKNQTKKAEMPSKSTTLPKMELPSQTTCVGGKRKSDFAAEGGADSKRMEILTNAAEAASSNYPMQMAMSPALASMTAPFPPMFQIPTSHSAGSSQLPSVPSFLSGMSRGGSGHGGVMAMATAAAAAQAAAVAQAPNLEQVLSLAREPTLPRAPTK